MNPLSGVKVIKKGELGPPDQLPRRLSLVVSAGLGEPIGVDAVFLGCAYGADSGVASLSASYPVAEFNDDGGIAFFLFPFCLVNFVKGMCNLV